MQENIFEEKAIRLVNSSDMVRMFMTDVLEDSSETNPLYWGNYGYNPYLALNVFSMFANVLMKAMMNLKNDNVNSINLYCSTNKIFGKTYSRS